jgi:hypothetical protein
MNSSSYGKERIKHKLNRPLFQVYHGKKAGTFKNIDHDLMERAQTQNVA